MLITGTIGRRVRRLTILLTVLIAADVLAACGDDAPDAAPPGTNMTEDSMGQDGMDASPVAADARRVEVTARSFGFGPDEITVNAGEDIAVELTSEDTLHDFVIDDLDAHVAAEADKTAVGGFRADEPGRYAFYCSVAGHREAGMEGVVVVEA
ncbi:MAG: cupredoxin domain-containing protein [Acidimicrobiia bacterium]|nr:cupredoxin domain-containing protein [Acidimicrobiia bacterium]